MNWAHRRFPIGLVTVASLLVIAALTTTAAAAASGPSLILSPGGSVLNGQRVEVAGAGLAPGVNGIVVECNDAPGQPMVETHGVTLPISCVNPFALEFPYSQWVFTTSAAGTFDVTVVVRTGVLGPPSDTATADSIGADPATDAARFPCPPTQAQQADGVSCGLLLMDGGGDHAQASLAFGPPLSGPPSVVLQGTGAAPGDTVTVVASGLTPNSPTLVEECNLTPGEPPDEFNPGPVIGCTTPVGPPDPFDLPVSSDTGRLTTTITLGEGNLGGLAASAPYPCPPTPAQVAAGSTCDIVVEDGAFRVGAAPVTSTGPVPIALASPGQIHPSMVVAAPPDAAPLFAFAPLGWLGPGSSVIALLSGFTPDSPGLLFVCPFVPSPTLANASLTGPCTLAAPGFVIPADGNDIVSVSPPLMGPVEALVAVDAAGDRAVATHAALRWDA
jgi:hypothetical protein